MFEGSFVAIVTPMKSGAVDLRRIAELSDWHRSQGTRGLVPFGTTGEGPTIEPQERHDIIRAIRKAAGKLKIVAGAGSNSTKQTVENVKLAADAGADAVLVVVPYYNKPTQEGQYRHFEIVARSTKLPIMIYNIPSRTGVNIAPETVARLARLENVVAIKEASGSMEQIAAIRATCDIEISSGDDGVVVPVMEMGGVGVVSVAGNIVPARIAELCDLAASGKRERARTMQQSLAGLIKTLFLETNPGPIKTAMKMMGLIESAELRLPLVTPTDATESAIASMLKTYKLLPGMATTRRRPAAVKR